MGHALTVEGAEHRFDHCVVVVAFHEPRAEGGGGPAGVVAHRQIEVDLLRGTHIEIETHDGLTVESQAIVERLIEELPDDIRLNNTLIDHSKRTTSVVYRIVDGKATCTPVIVGAIVASPVLPASVTAGTVAAAASVVVPQQAAQIVVAAASSSGESIEAIVTEVAAATGQDEADLAAAANDAATESSEPVDGGDSEDSGSA